MGDKPDRQIVPRPESGGFFQELSTRAKLILRLLGDRRVNIFLKLLPVGSLVYLVMPDLAPGPIDDAAVIWLGAYLFVELCPPDVVQEHMRALTSVIEGEWREVPDSESSESKEEA
ncbi:MAG TPA: hypothetical protein VJK02_16985 [Anaerolineales bacterium]|nr:hypothetical protein [Anaerolineales bacterium]